MRLRYGKRPRISARDVQLIMLIGLVALIVLGTLIGADIRISESLPGGGGFLLPWHAARMFLFEHVAAYGTTVQQQVDKMAYGGTAPVGERPYRLTTPFFLVLAYFPIAGFSAPTPVAGFAGGLLHAFSNPATARGIWLFIDQAALVAMALLTLRLIEWQPNRALQIGFALACVFSLYSVAAMVEGGPTILLGLIYCAVLYAYAREEDELAGALLSLALFEWEVGLFLILLVMWKATYERRWRVWAGFGMLLAVLVIISFLIYPGWLVPFASANLAVLRTPFGTTSTAMLERLWPTYGERAAQALTILLVLLLLYEWAATLSGNPRRFIWAGCLTLALTPLIGLRVELPNLVVILPGMALILAGIAHRWRTGYWLAGLLLLAVVLLPWGWFTRFTLLGDRAAYDYILLFLPVVTAAGLYFTRWWFVRPPRTWLDQVRSALSHTQPISRPRPPMG